MTPDQFTRWRDFAVRLAGAAFAGDTEPDAKWIARNVAEFIDGIPEDDIPCILDWDSAKRYQEGSPSYYRTRCGPCWACNGTKRNGNKPCESRGCEGGIRYEYEKPNPLCDTFAQWRENELFYHWRGYATEEDMKRFDAAEPDDEDDIKDEIVDRWSGPVSACVRAALDVAVAPSMGVLGFTAGDIRSAYPEGVPTWIKDYFKDAEVVQLDKACPGVGFTTNVVGKSEAFDDIPDDARLWL